MARRPWRCSVLFLLLSALFGSAHAFAWDDATHCLITRLAIEALPASPLRSLMRTNQSALERYSDEPDSVLKARYGEAEA
ncbi:MAG TPA: hypothetical protein VEJ86_03355, partial [Candidatus Binataceae bacterium]|nr:hypothetical protein [Candidatus Binataceae bacterium]